MNNTTNLKANFTTTTTSSASSTQVPKDLAITVVAFLSISILAGTFGNASVCVLLRRRQDLRKVPHYLLGNLAVIGVFSALFNMPLLIVMTTVNYFQTGVMPVVEIFCKVGFASGYACMVVNALTLWLMAFDRHDCVLRPFNRRLTTRNVKKVLAVTWTLALITAVLFIILIRIEPSVCIDFYPYNNMVTDHGGTSFTVLQVVVGQLDKITIVILMVTFFRIMKAFHTSAVSPSNSSQQRLEKELTKLTFKICIIFLLFRVPYLICHIVLQIVGFQGAPAKTVSLVTYAMVNYMYVTNPFLHRKMLAFRPPNQTGAMGSQLELGDSHYRK